jgi:hypothetical protein
MSCVGVWSVEMKGPYGWERISTAFMRDGEYLGASADHYSVGSYREDGDDLEISMVLTQYGAIRTIFGRKSAGKLQVMSKGKIKKNKIICTSTAKGIKHFDIQLRFTRLDSL